MVGLECWGGRDEGCDEHVEVDEDGEVNGDGPGFVAFVSYSQTHPKSSSPDD